MEADLRRKRQQLHELEFQISRIERGLNHLPADERDVVTAKYINRLSWEKTAASLFMSINLCYRLADRATETLAIMLFGQNACPAWSPKIPKKCAVLRHVSTCPRQITRGKDKNVSHGQIHSV